ncbi:MAG: ComEC/Rec2 family competence protein [Aquirufa sp.]
MYSIFSKFPFVRILLYWIIGILFAEYITIEIPLFYGILIVIVWFIFLLCRLQSFQSTLFFVLVVVLSYLNSINFNKHSFPLKESKPFVFKVISTPISKPKTWSFDAEIIALHYDNGWRKVHKEIKVFLSKKCIKPKIDAAYISISTLEAIKGPVFPNEQNWVKYYQRKGIVASVFIPEHEISILENGDNRFHFSVFFQTIQDALAKHITRTFISSRNREVACAMLLGVRSHIDFDTMQSYASLGAIHILSVSGLHVGLLYLGLSFMLGFLMKKGKWGKWLFFILMLAFLWFYAGISGFSAPVLRSAWMFSFMLFAKSFNQQQNTLNLLAVSCFIILLVDPNMLFQSGFQLSYLAVLGLLLYQSKIASWIQISSKNKVVYYLAMNSWDLTAVAIAAQIFTLPLVIYYFHQLPHPFYFFLLNLILIFLSSISLGIGLFFIAIAEIFWNLKVYMFYYFVGSLVEKSFDLLHAVMFYVVDGFHPVISFLQIEIWEIFVFLMILIFIELWIVFRGFQWLILCAVLMLVLLYNHFRIIPQKVQDQEEVYFSQFKNELVWIGIKKNRAILFANKNIIVDPTWVQAHFSPLCAYHHVTDTLKKELPEHVNLTWIWKGKRFVYLQNASEKTDKNRVDFLILGAKIKWKNPYWLPSWKSAKWYFIKTPSTYYQKKIKPIILENNRFAIALDTFRGKKYDVRCMRF